MTLKASTDNGLSLPNRLTTLQLSTGGQSYSLHSHLTMDKLSTDDLSLAEPLLEPEADTVTNLNLS